jgi:hypothetical protein
MLRKELVSRAERKLEAARDSVRQATAGLGEKVEGAADAVASTVQNLTLGIAAGAAAAKVERMSGGECVAELVRTKVRGDQSRSS